MFTLNDIDKNRRRWWKNLMQSKRLVFGLVNCLSGGVIKVGTSHISLQAFKEEIPFADCCLGSGRLI